MWPSKNLKTYWHVRWNKNYALRKSVTTALKLHRFFLAEKDVEFCFFASRIYHLCWLRCCRKEESTLGRTEQAAARHKVVVGFAKTQLL